MTTQNTNHYSIGSVETALELLEAFCEQDGEFSITHLAQRLGVSKSKVFRLLATFEQKGYVKKSGSQGKYDIGISAFETSRKLLSRMDLLSKAKPVMDRLVRECSESVYLAVPTGNDVLLLEMVNTNQQVQTIPLVGRRFPIAEVAAGAVICWHTTQRRALGREWDQAKEHGYCLDHDKLAAGVTSIAAPILAKHNHAIGSLCMVGPSFRFADEASIKPHISGLQSAAALLSAQLGFLEKGFSSWSK